MQKRKGLSGGQAAPMGLLCCRMLALINISGPWSSRLVRCPRRRRAWWQGDPEGTVGVQAAGSPALPTSTNPVQLIPGL